MSKTPIPDKVKTQLWALSAGRCEYYGCNKRLWRDDITMNKMNKSYIAHIVSDSPKGPRGDKVRSKLLAKDYNNLMLLCDECHRRIDKENVGEHTEQILINMKQDHEKRIELLTSLLSENQSHIIIYGSNIGKQKISIPFCESAQALLPKKYPTDNYGIDLGIKNSLMLDDENLYWKQESENLERQFKEKIEPLRLSHPVKSFSVFGIAPQPLLIKLGVLLSELYEVDVYQKHRTPNTWKWQEENGFEGFFLTEPTDCLGIPVLNLSLSATITNDRIESLFKEKISIWTISHKNPNVEFLKSKSILNEFKKICRSFFDRAKAKHGQKSELHIFPAMPISAAIEFGRIWMPKADMKMIIYDQNTIKDGFYQTLKF